MFTKGNFIRDSLELHLFFARIMKEHSLFLQVGFTQRDFSFIQQADVFRQEFDRLLWEVVSLSNGIVSSKLLSSGEIYTNYTLDAELVTSYYTGIRIPTEITKAEQGIEFGEEHVEDIMHAKRVYSLNQRAVKLISDLISFKSTILNNVLTCKMFTVNYPLLIDHIMREAKLYLGMVQKLQSGEEFDIRNEMLEQEAFWNRIMAEHAKFIRGLLDPTEESLINMANNFGNEFDQLTEEAKMALDENSSVAAVTEESLQATKKIRDFKAQGTQGLLECKVRSVILPLLGDHTLREANHFLRLLNSFKNNR